MNIEDIAFLDAETRSLPDAEGTDADLSMAGTYRYASKSFVIILTYAIGEQPVRCLALDKGFKPEPPNFGPGYRVGDDIRMPLDLRNHLQRVEAGKAWMAAWNAGFDRQAWNEGTLFEPLLRPEHTIDVMAQAVASNLPASLEGASKFIGRAGKQHDGKALIKLFCAPNGGTPQTHPEEWKRFKSYAVIDTAELREVWRSTRQLPMEEWKQYWASERINDRGKAVDLEFCRKADLVSKLDAARTNRLLNQYTNGQITTVHQHARIADWIWDNISSSHPEARDMLISKFDEDDEEGFKVAKLSAERSRVTRLIDFYKALEKRDGALAERDELLLKLLQLREYGASSAPKKFGKIMQQHVDGALYGGYVWNGAQQTGRFSSKGVQEHNLTRAVLGPKGALEPKAIEMIMDLEV